MRLTASMCFNGVDRSMVTVLKLARDTESFARMASAEKASKLDEFTAKWQSNMFNLIAADIETSVAGAVAKCCADTSVSKEVRFARARGLVQLGRIFQHKPPKEPRQFLIKAKERARLSTERILQMYANAPFGRSCDPVVGLCTQPRVRLHSGTRDRRQPEPPVSSTE
jgi:hypothetical protein